jgi:UDP-N-acetylglucosamine--N-acetylmuramyl-(pentapeptide) pyrophosphoryl-undecaprenol N-acetylglucosamine transferase
MGFPLPRPFTKSGVNAKTELRLLATGGGTGGHIYPALAVCDALRERGVTVAYVGKRDSMEARLVPEHGFPFHTIYFSGMPRRLTWQWLPWLGQWASATRDCIRIINDFQPQAVFATGGYVSAPLVLAAILCRVPFMLHEPDAHPGIMNRTLSQWAAMASTAFPNVPLKTPHIRVTGNPLRGTVGSISRPEAFARVKPDWNPARPTLLIFGGSQGARTLNNAVLQALPELLTQYQVIHQTGQTLFEETRQKLPFESHPNYWVAPFFNNMADLLAMADVALCRAGALTLSELYAAGLPSILVPYPYAAQNHQHKNALASVQAGASVLLTDSNCTGPQLLATLQTMPPLATMRQASLKLARPNATQDIVEMLMTLFPG